MELLIAMSIFMFLGVILISMLRSGVRAWHRGEMQREIHETAQIVLNQMREDIEAAYTSRPLDPAAGHRSLFICDYDCSNRARLRFVRSMSDASQGFAGAFAGDYILPQGCEAFINLARDRDDAIDGILKPTGGLCEVAYVMGGSDQYENKMKVLYRGICSPPHDSSRSLFLDSNIEWPYLADTCRFFADRILYLGFEFWTQYTNTWRRYPPETYYTRNAPQDIDGADTERTSGPLDFWDSTRGRVPPGMGDPIEPEDDEFLMNLGTPGDPTDDIFPSKVRITLVIEDRVSGRDTELTKDLGSDTTLIYVDHPEPFAKVEPKFIKINDEWIRIEGLQYGKIKVAEGGRGARGTMPQTHSRGDVVQAGRTFTLVVALPGSREDWRE
jgi:hypothetical protein